MFVLLTPSSLKPIENERRTYIEQPGNSEEKQDESPFICSFFHHRNITGPAFCRLCQRGSAWLYDGTVTMRTLQAGPLTLGKIPTDPSAGCYLGWITRMWRTTPPVGWRTLFPLVHVFAGLPVLIPSPERFLRINLQLLMELVACFSTSIWILLIKFAPIPMKTVWLGIVLFIQI